MLAPQFHIRSLMALTVVAAVVGLISNYARHQVIWAQTVVFVLLIIGLSFLLYGLMFLVALLVSGGMSTLVNKLQADEPLPTTASHSPFAEHRPPPQLVQPEDPV